MITLPDALDEAQKSALVDFFTTERTMEKMILKGELSEELSFDLLQNEVSDVKMKLDESCFQA
jgi:hypothetical protein